MDLFSRLTQEHVRHRELAQQLEETSGDSVARQRQWGEFLKDVQAHANAEEQTLYAALIEDPLGQEKAQHSISEHKEAADLMAELDALDMSSSAWLQKFRKLKEELEHHMDEEENEVFLLAKKLFAASTADSLAEKFDRRKQAELD